MHRHALAVGFSRSWPTTAHTWWVETLLAHVFTDVWLVWLRIAAVARTCWILTLLAYPVALAVVVLHGTAVGTTWFVDLTSLAFDRKTSWACVSTDVWRVWLRIASGA